MKQVLDILNKMGIYYLATTEGEQPQVRPIGFAMELDGKLAFCTGNGKDMYRQMVANPRVAISGFDGQNILRITGKARFVTTEAAQQKALQVMPDLANLYAVGDGVFEIFVLEEATARCDGMDGSSSELEI